MSQNEQAFTSHHATQYTVLSSDMRFYADQRFKLVTVFLVASGLLANVVKDHPSLTLGALGAVLGFLCLGWELDTTRWWGTLITQCQELEAIAMGSSSKCMVPGYTRYRDQIPRTGLQKLPHAKPSTAVQSVYFVGILGWIAFAGWCYFSCL